MTDAEKLVACLREIGFEAAARRVDYDETFRGLAPAKNIRQRVEVGCHFLFDADGKLAGVQSEYDGWVTSVSAESIAIVGYKTEAGRVVAIDLLFRDATHARKLLSLMEYRDAHSGRTVYVLPETPTVTPHGIVHTLRFRHA
jgi:hypothetical protein